MSVSPAGIGKMVGAVAGLGGLAALIFWFRASYSIEGTIIVDMGTHKSPARQIEVRLIDRAAEDRITNLVAEYQMFREAWPTIMASQLFVKALENVATAAAPRDTALDIGRLEVSGARGTDDPKEVAERVATYRAHAAFCRARSEDCPLGKEFYRRGAAFWEGKAHRIEKTGSLDADDESVRYVTTWMDSSGLGDEPVQVVSVVRSTNATDRARPGRSRNGDTVRAVGKPVRREGGVVPGSTLTSNEVGAAAVAFQQALDKECRTMIPSAEKILLDMTVATTNTDDEGAFVFNAGLQPGAYLVFARYDASSTENENVSFIWFQPVNVTAKRFAFSRRTVVPLDELNQRRPQVLEVKTPTAEDVYTDLAAQLCRYTQTSASALGSEANALRPEPASGRDASP